MTILNDALFVQYGGQTGTSTPEQRTAAYTIAESNAQVELGTFLSPTLVSGTYTWPPFLQSFTLDYSHLKGINSVVGIHEAGCDCLPDAVELSGCAWIMNAEGSIIQVRECGNTIRSGSVCGCWGYGKPFQVRVVYTVGLATGTHTDPSLLQALAIGAQIALDQATSFSFSGDPGIKSFRSLSYSETRSDESIKHTAFGDSPAANYAAQLLKRFKVKRVFKMGF